MDFIDLTGASGAAYRFRRWPAAGRHAPTAGNFALVSERTRKTLAVGMLNDLSHAPRRIAVPKGAVLYTRLNIGRKVREAEHADLIAVGLPAAGSDVEAQPQSAGAAV